MLLFTITFGGLLLMMGRHSRAESLFYYFRLEDQVPENHLLRLNRSPRQLGIYSSQVEGRLQRRGKAIDRPRTAVAHAAGRRSLRRDERRETGGRATHASGVAL